MPRLLEKLKTIAKRLKRDVITLMFIAKDTAAPLIPKILAMAVAAYALSPVDLIPDFIPIIGYLDDLIIVPLGIWLCLRLTPADVIERNRARAETWLAEKNKKPRSYAGLGIVVCIWLALVWLLYPSIRSWLGR